MALILTLIVLAKLAGETTLCSTSQWVRLRGDWLAEQLQLSRTTFPCAATYSNVLKRVDAQEVTLLIQQCLKEWEGICRRSYHMAQTAPFHDCDDGNC